MSHTILAAMILDLLQWVWALVYGLADGIVGWVIWLIGAGMVVVVVGAGAVWRKVTGGKARPGGAPPDQWA